MLKKALLAALLLATPCFAQTEWGGTHFPGNSNQAPIPTGGISNNTVLGNNSGSYAAATALSPTAVAALLNGLFDAPGAAATATSTAVATAEAASLQRSANLSDVANAATALANLGAQAVLGYAPLNPSNNLSDVSSTTLARTNLGLGTAAVQSASAFDTAGAAASAVTTAEAASLQKAANLSDVASAATALANLGAQAALGYTPLNPGNNLSDVANAGTARTNLGAQASLGYTPLAPSNNLSDVSSAAASLAHLLGAPSAATYSIICSSSTSCAPTVASAGGAAFYSHTLTGATPTAVVNSSTVPSTDQENLITSANVTSFTLPAASAVADGETLRIVIAQPASGGPFTLPTGTALSPFTAGSGTTLVNSIPNGCPTIGTTVSSSAPSELISIIEYQASLTQWIILGCQTANGAQSGAQEVAVSATGLYGALSTNAVVASYVMVNPGRITGLIINNGTGGTCTTAPTFNIFDGASNTGTAKIASAVQQSKGTATFQSETQTVAIGDIVGVYVSTAGGTCTVPTFGVSIQISEP